jgi:hypothetical protein
MSHRHSISMARLLSWKTEFAKSAWSVPVYHVRYITNNFPISSRHRTPWRSSEFYTKWWSFRRSMCKYIQRYVKYMSDCRQESRETLLVGALAIYYFATWVIQASIVGYIECTCIGYASWVVLSRHPSSRTPETKILVNDHACIRFDKQTQNSRSACSVRMIAMVSIIQMENQIIPTMPDRRTLVFDNIV